MSSATPAPASEKSPTIAQEIASDVKAAAQKVESVGEAAVAEAKSLVTKDEATVKADVVEIESELSGPIATEAVAIATHVQKWCASPLLPPAAVPYAQAVSKGAGFVIMFLSALPKSPAK